MTTCLSASFSRKARGDFLKAESHSVPTLFRNADQNFVSIRLLVRFFRFCPRGFTYVLVTYRECEKESNELNRDKNGEKKRRKRLKTVVREMHLCNVRTAPISAQVGIQFVHNTRKYSANSF